MKCVTEVSNGQGGWDWHRCSREAIVTEDGKGYCKQHAPSNVKARSDATMARYRAKLDAEANERNRPYKRIEELTLALERIRLRLMQVNDGSQEASYLVPPCLQIIEQAIGKPDPTAPKKRSAA